jgi:hypothetical protein
MAPLTVLAVIAGLLVYFWLAADSGPKDHRGWWI